MTFGEWWDRSRRLAYRLGFQPGQWFHLTPGELNALADVAAEREEEEWFRIAFLASQITVRVWANKASSPYEILGWEMPATPFRKQRNVAKAYEFWERMVDSTRRGH